MKNPSLFWNLNSKRKKQRDDINCLCHLSGKKHLEFKIITSVAHLLLEGTIRIVFTASRGS